MATCNKCKSYKCTCQQKIVVSAEPQKIIEKVIIESKPCPGPQGDKGEKGDRGPAGSTDYVSSVEYSELTKSLDFTGIGNAFAGSVDLTALKDDTNSFISNVELIDNELVFTATGVGPFSGAIDLSSLVVAGGAVVSADNGLGIDPANNVQLGGTLLKNTSIDNNGFDLLISRIGGINTLTVTNTSGTAVKGETTTGNAVFGVASTSGVGVSGNSVDGIGTQGYSANSLGGQFSSEPSSGNSVVSVLRAVRFTSGTPANGIGASFDFNISTNTSGGVLATKLISKWTDVTNATRTSQFSIRNYNSGVEKEVLLIEGNGYVGINDSSPLSMLSVKGEDATSSNFALKVQNSVANKLLEIRNDGLVTAGSSSNNQPFKFLQDTGNIFLRGDFGVSGVNPLGTVNTLGFYWYDTSGTQRKGAVDIALRVDNIGATYVDNTLTIGDTLKVSRRAGIGESGGVVIAPSAITAGPSAALDIQNFAPSTFAKSLRIFSNTNTPASTIAEFRSTSNEVLRMYGDSSLDFNSAKITTGDFRINGVTDDYLFFTDASTNRVGINTNTPTSKLQVVGLPTYADNAAALAGGLTAGAMYIRTGHGLDITV